MTGSPEAENLARLLGLLETLVASLPAEKPQDMADRLIHALSTVAKREARLAVDQALETRSAPASAPLPTPQVPSLSAEEIYDAVAQRLRPHIERVVKEALRERGAPSKVPELEPTNPIVQELAWRLSESRRRHRSSR